jgi:hypothetical protein
MLTGSVVIKDRERDVKFWKNFKVYFKWVWNKSPFDINSKQGGVIYMCFGISNLHISTIFLLNVGTVPTVWYIFFHFIIGYEKTPAELQLLKKIGQAAVADKV